MNLTDSIFQEPGIVLSSALKYVYVNDAYVKLIKRPVNLGSSFVDVHPGAERSLAVTQFANALNAHKKVIYEDYCAEASTWFECRISPVPEGIAILFLDITARKRAADQQERSDRQWRGMLQGCAVAIAQISLDGRFLAMNKRCLEVTGLSEEELKKLSFNDLCLGDGLDTRQADLASLVAGTKERIIFECQIRRGHGQEVWIHLTLSLLRSSGGSATSFVILFDDIAERKEAEESLVFALDSAEMGDWDYDTVADCTRRSERFNLIFGYTAAPAHWGYAEFLSHIHPDDRSMFDERVTEALRQGENYNVEVRIVWPDASVHWISLRGRVYLKMGRAIRMAGLVLDITQEKKIAQDLQLAKLAAEDANREKSYFLANMSHEIRTPLGAILGFTELLRDPALGAAERSRYLDILDRNGKSLMTLIGDILDLSKVEAGHLEIEESKVNIGEVLDDLSSLLRVKADAKGIALRVQVDPLIPKAIMTDAIRARQILINVIGNAIKFTREGFVEITAHAVTHPGHSAGWVCFFVKDTGTGISKAQSRRLFHPFMQADSSTTRKFGGTGLGLALSRRLARAMGGDLTLKESRPGKGSTFVISIPIKSVDKSVKLTTRAVEATPKIAQPSFDGIRVLLAEDSEDNQELISHILQKIGVNTEFADNGEQAVAKALKSEFDVVLMDMQMPKLDGYGATRELRRAGFSRPIIALTANAMRHDRDKCIEAGCTEYLSKPVDPLQLYRLMKIVLESQMQ